MTISLLVGNNRSGFAVMARDAISHKVIPGDWSIASKKGELTVGRTSFIDELLTTTALSFNAPFED
jgi:hypothetical protein